MSNEKAYEDFNKQTSLYNQKNNFLNKNDFETTNSIHSNIELVLKEEEELNLELLSKIMSKERILREYLMFDLLNYTPEIKNLSSSDEVVDFCIKTLKKFQYKVGGFKIEDSDWLLISKSEQDIEKTRFKIKKNQKMLYNSIHRKNYNNDLVWFLESIIAYVRKHINNDNLKVKCNVFEDTKNVVYWVGIILEDRTEMQKIKEEFDNFREDTESEGSFREDTESEGSFREKKDKENQNQKVQEVEKDKFRNKTEEGETEKQTEVKEGNKTNETENQKEEIKAENNAKDEKENQENNQDEQQEIETKTEKRKETGTKKQEEVETE